MELRFCKKCQQHKPYSEFHRYNRIKDGYYHICKQCRSRAKPKPEAPEGYKLCRACGGAFPATLEYFKKDARIKSGIATICKLCASNSTREYYGEHVEERREYNRQRYWLNPDYHRAQNKIWYQNHKPEHRAREKKWREENPELQKQRDRNYYLTHRVIIIERSKKWREDNNEQYRAYNTSWFEQNPEKAKAIRQTTDSRRRARKRSLSNDFTLADWELGVAYWDRKCAICGRPPDDELALAPDHWIPLKAHNCPGTVVTNLIPMCDGKTGCNTHKQARDGVKWLIQKLGETAAREKLREIEAFFEYMKGTRITP